MFVGGISSFVLRVRGGYEFTAEAARPSSSSARSKPRKKFATNEQDLGCASESSMLRGEVNVLLSDALLGVSRGVFLYFEALLHDIAM